MNPLYQMFAFFCSCDKRVCRKCGKTMLVQASKRHEKVKCKHCGEVLPPLKP